MRNSLALYQNYKIIAFPLVYILFFMYMNVYVCIKSKYIFQYPPAGLVYKPSSIYMSYIMIWTKASHFIAFHIYTSLKHIHTNTQKKRFHFYSYGKTPHPHRELFCTLSLYPPKRS